MTEDSAAADGEAIEEVSSAEGLLYKAKETVRSLVSQRPSLRRLRANRTQHFEQAHAILPSDALVGESLSLTLQAWDQCERLVAFLVPISHLVAFLVPISHLVAVLPLPGGLGGVELALTTVLVALAGLSLPVAGAAVLLYRLCSYWFLLGLGALASVYAAVSLSELATDPADAASCR